MKRRLLFLIKVYIWFLALFILLKPVFMLYHSKLFAGAGFAGYFNVIRHGFGMDLAVTSYIIAPLLLAVLVSVWLQGKWIKYFSRAYVSAISAVAVLIMVADMELYSYWGFRIDATPLFYLANPGDAVASLDTWKVVLILAIYAVLAFAVAYYPWKLAALCDDWRPPRKRIATTLAFILLSGITFISIRGGIGTSTMSPGRAYFSTDAQYNNAAINPVFSLLYSVAHENDFSRYARYMDGAEAGKTVSALRGATCLPDDTACWLNTRRPNILMIILESFSSGAWETGSGEVVMSELEKISEDGIFFTNTIANSFRTDRGLYSILGGFPALPTMSVMKYPAKMQNMPNLMKELGKYGYKSRFIYGGDADFTNMSTFFRLGGAEEIISDKDFDVSRLASKWGANDGITCSFLAREMKNREQEEPFFDIYLTLSSHEPFEVPYKKFDDPYLNSVAYADSCVGAFISEFRKMPLWENTLVILVADHGVGYLLGYNEQGEARQRIPMIWTGGAVKTPAVVDEYVSQSDIPATLLAQMGIDYESFPFSRNLVDPSIPKFGYYTYPNGFGWIDGDNNVVFDCDSDRPVYMQGLSPDSCLYRGKALLQKLYDAVM